MAGNEATEVNKADVGIGITSHGSDWFWACFSIFALMALIHGSCYLFYNKGNTKNKAVLHVAPIMTSIIMAVVYYTMASNLGWAGVVVEFDHIQIGDNTRQIFYSKYVGWFLAFPTLLYEFELNSMAQNIFSPSDYFHIYHTLFLQVTATEVMILGLLIGSVIHSTYKFGYWTFGVVGGIFFLTVFSIHQFRTPTTSKITKFLVPFYGLCFILYPVSWGLSEGGNVIQPDSEGVFYGVLDLINFWLIPLALIYDARKNGQFIDDTKLPVLKNNDEEKQIQSDPELRASGETEVGNHDEGALETQRDTVNA